MKIQQHDDVVVEAAVTAAGLRRSTARGRGVAGRGGRHQGVGCGCPPTPPIYIRTPRGAPALEMGSLGGWGGGQGGRRAPQGKWRRPLP